MNRKNFPASKFAVARNNENADKLKINVIAPLADAKRKLRPSKSSAKLPEKVDLHLAMSKDAATGQRTLTIGSKINSKWTDLSLRQESDWWNRLHYVPLRYQRNQPSLSEASPARKFRTRQDELNNIRCASFNAL